MTALRKPSMSFLALTLACLLQSCESEGDPKKSLQSDFTPPTGADLTSGDLESPAYFRLVMATSSDGTTFSTSNELITDQANTPNFILKENRLFLYYTGWTLGSQKNTIAVAISDDFGKTWAFKNCSFSGFGTGVKPVDPDPILLSNGKIRMFATTNIGTKRGILCYESTDGLTFNYVETAVSSTTDDIFDSNTFQINNTWHMYAINGKDPLHWHLTSTDGIEFTVANTKTFLDGTDQHFVGKGFSIGANYRIMSSFLPKKNVKSFTTTNGTDWTLESGNRIAYGNSSLEHEYTKDPAAVKLPDNTYLMAYVTRIQ